MSCNWNPTSTREGYHAIKNDASNDVVVPTNFVRSEDGSIDFNKTTNYAQSKQNDRAANIQAVPWQEDTEGTLNFSYDSNESVFLLYGVLGDISSADVSSATDGSVYDHTIEPDLCLPTFSYEEGIGRITDTSNNRQNVLIKRSYGATINSAKLTIADERAMIEANVVSKGQLIQADVLSDVSNGSSVVVSLNSIEGFVVGEDVNIYDDTPTNETATIDAISTTNKTITLDTLSNSYQIADNAKVELIPQTPSYSLAQQLFASGQATVQFGEDLTAAGSAAAGCIRDASISIDNQVEKKPCLGKFAAGAGGIVPKGRLVTVEFTRSFQNKEDMDKYIQARSFAMIITLDNEQVVSTTDTNDATHKLVLKLPKVTIDSMPITSENNGVYEYTVSATAVPDSTAWWDIQAIATNGKAGTYYTA